MAEQPNIPASVRGAVDLSELASQHQAEPSPSAVSADSQPTWRFEVSTGDDFQNLVQESSRGAVIMAFWAEHSAVSVQTLDTLQQVVDSARGNMLLATVDIEKHPEIAQAFQVQSVPAAVAIIGGRPAPLFTGQVSDQQIVDVLQQVLQLAAQQQLPGGFEPAAGSEDEKPLPPLHQEAADAIEAGDYAAASAAFQKALNENPGDRDAKIGIAQVALLERVSQADLQEARSAAASDPADLEAALKVADLDVTGGHVEDAFNRLIRLFKIVPAEDKNRVRERLLELFEVVGAQDPRVSKARADLMMALF